MSIDDIIRHEVRERRRTMVLGFGLLIAAFVLVVVIGFAIG